MVTIWEAIHWQFSTYYLQTACLFRITFRASSEADFQKVNRRRKKLLALEYVGYIVFSLFFVYLIV